MNDQQVAARVMVVSAMKFGEPAQILRHFLYLADNVQGLTDETICEATKMLQHALGESPSGTPRLLLGVEIASILCEQGEDRVWVTSRLERVFKQYAKILTEMVLGNDHISVGDFPRFNPFLSDEFELMLDIAQIIAISTSLDSIGTVNTLIRTIVATAPQEVLEAKICQLESPDFRVDKPRNHERFRNVLAIKYLERFSGAWEMLIERRYPKNVIQAAKVNVDWKRFTLISETEIWEMLRRNCEITEPNQDQLLQRQFLTSELLRRHPDGNMVKEWFIDNFPHLVMTQ